MDDSAKEPEDEFLMSFTPRQAQTCGGQSIFFSFSGMMSPIQVETLYYIIFEGSELRHITSAKQINPYTLQAIIPEHDKSESTMMSICHSRDGKPVVVSADKFSYTLDSTYLLAQSLAMNSLNGFALTQLEGVYQNYLNAEDEELKAVDHRLTASFRQLDLASTWRIAPPASEDLNGNSNGWNLLHFCAKFDLMKLAEFLIDRPGATEATQLLSQEGMTPLDVAKMFGNDAVMEVLTRVPSEEKITDKSSVKINCPSVKGHKLGTTTITNANLGGQHALEEDVRLLEELHSLARETKKSSLSDDDDADSENECGPLATSLFKLKRINQEIQRLRDLTCDNGTERRRRAESCPKSMRFCESIRENGFIGNAVDMPGVNCAGIKEESDKNEKEDLKGELSEEDVEGSSTPRPSTTSIENADGDETDGDTEKKVLEEKKPVDEERVVCVQDSGTECHPEVRNTDVSYLIENEQKESSEDIGDDDTPFAKDGETDAADNDSVTNTGMPEESEVRGLASVAEETEEELERVAQEKTGIVSENDRELKRPPSAEAGAEKDPDVLPASAVSALRKERPLSDSLENLKLVEREVNMALKDDSSGSRRFGFLNKLKSKSLDTLLDHSGKEKVSSILKTSSQVSLQEVHRSTDSLLSVPDSPETTRSDSMSRESRHSHEASQLSLNDVCFSFSSQEDDVLSERKGFPFRFSFKKAKSLTSLEMKKSKKQDLLEDDRRKTIMGGICTEKVFMKRTQEMENSSEINTPVAFQDTSLRTYVLARYNTQSAEDKSSHELVVTVQPPKSERLRSTSDVASHKLQCESESDTDEGTSTVIESKEKDKKSDKDRRFNLLRSKTKKKVKDKKDVEKSSKDKVPKKSHKNEKANSTAKSEGKGGFLTKRGTSFRQSLRSVPSPLPLQEQQKMFQRASSIGPSSITAVKHAASLSTLRASGQKSPTQSRRTTVHEFDGHADSDSLPNLSSLRQQSSSRTSLDLESLMYDEDFQDGHLYDDLGEYDSDLDLKDEPQTWSELVDKRVQRKMHAKDIKRQDVIYELILTESNYVRTLNIMYKIYYFGMLREMNFDSSKIDQIFPRLEDLLDINGKFLADLKARQEQSDNNVIESIGDILVDRWCGEKGEFMKEVYGYFCSRHLQAVAFYKELLKTDKNFANFIKNCMMKERVRRLSIPECITLVTQRLTKYPLLIEAIIKATKESKPDYANLKRALELIKDILVGVDDYVRDYEKEKRLEEIKKRLDPKGEVQLKTSKKIYKAVKLFPKRSQLIFDDTVTLRGKSKSVETRAVLLSTRLIFLQEKDNSKYTVLSLEQKSPVVSLKNLMVREVATDHKALFLVSTSTEGPDMYEMAFASSRERKSWMESLSFAIKNCPEEEEENQSDLEEENRKEEESKSARLKEIVDQLGQLNVQISALIADKNKVVSEMRELLEKMDNSTGKPSTGVELKQVDVLNARETLDSVVNEVSTLTNIICGSETAFSPTPSPTTPNNSTAKRAETFGGFDTKQGIKPPPPAGIGRASSMRHDMKANSKSSSSLEVESQGLNKDPKGVRRPSQGGMLMSVLNRAKGLGSQEDLSLLGTSTSMTSLNSISSQLASLTHLKDSLMLLVEVTNKQDLEVASVRLALHEARNELSKVRSEKEELEERVAIQQKDHEKQMNRQHENYQKLQRELRRTIEKAQKQSSEHRERMSDSNSDVHKYLHGSLGNLKLSGKNKHSRHKSTGERSSTPPSAQSTDSSQDIETQQVIYF